MTHYSFGISGSSNGNDSFTKILLSLDGVNGQTTFPDTAAGATSTHTWARSGGATLSSASYKFAPTSLNVPAASYITSTSSDYNLGSGDFTIDFWFNNNGDNLQYNRYFMGRYVSGSGRGTYFRFQQSANGGQLLFNVMIAGVNYGVLGGNFTNNNQWVHAAVVRSATTLIMFLNGVIVDTSNVGSGAITDEPTPFNVGTTPGADAGLPDYDFRGYIDQVRLSVGIARWTANFTPPNGPYF